MHHFQFSGAGLGLRSSFISELLTFRDKPVDFLEIAPENWMGIEGRRKQYLLDYSKCYPIIAHGLNLSIGGPAPLDISFIDNLSHFFTEFGIKHYSEHFSYCSDDKGYLYDLLPIPFTEEAVKHVSQRIIEVQDRLQMQIAFENSSYYYAPHQHLTESDFINAVIKESGCLLLLDVNNVYVNSFNHGYDPHAFIDALPSENIAYLHIAGHWQKTPELIIDTHGDAVIEPVWELLEHTYQIHGVKPTLLERDSEIPLLNELLAEVNQIKQCQRMEALV